MPWITPVLRITSADAQEAQRGGFSQLSPVARCRVPVSPDQRTALLIELRSDDCVVEVRYVGRGATTSVMVTDVETGDRTILDATELESLARGPATELRRLLSGLASDNHGAP